MHKNKSKIKHVNKLKLKEPESRTLSISTSPIRVFSKKTGLHENIFACENSSPLKISGKQDSKKKVAKFSKTFKAKSNFKKISLDEDLHFNALKTDDLRVDEKRQRSKERSSNKRVSTDTGKISDILSKKKNSIDESRLKDHLRDSKLDLKERLKINIDEVKKLKKSHKKIPTSDEKSLMSKRSQDFQLYLKGKINFLDKAKSKIDELKGKDKVIRVDFLDKKKKSSKPKKRPKLKLERSSIETNQIQGEITKYEISREKEDEIRELKKVDSPLLSNKSNESIAAGLKSEREDWINPWEFKGSFLNSEFVEEFKEKFKINQARVVSYEKFDQKIGGFEQSSDSQESQYLVDISHSPKKSISNLPKPSIPPLSLSLLKPEIDDSYSEDYENTVDEKEQSHQIVEIISSDSEDYGKTGKKSAWKDEVKPEPVKTLKQGQSFKTLDISNAKKNHVHGEESFANIEPEFTSFESPRKAQRSDISNDTIKEKNKSMEILVENYDFKEKTIENNQEKTKNLIKNKFKNEESLLSDELLTKSTENFKKTPEEKKKIPEKDEFFKYNLEDLKKIEFFEKLIQKTPITINNFYQSTEGGKYVKEEFEDGLKQKNLYQKGGNKETAEAVKDFPKIDLLMNIEKNPFRVDEKSKDQVSGPLNKKELQLITKIEDISISKNQIQSKHLKNQLKFQVESSSTIEIKPLSKLLSKSDLKTEQVLPAEEPQLKNGIESVSNIEIKSNKKSGSFKIEASPKIQIIQSQDKQRTPESIKKLEPAQANLIKITEPAQTNLLNPIKSTEPAQTTLLNPIPDRNPKQYERLSINKEEMKSSPTEKFLPKPEEKASKSALCKVPTLAKDLGEAEKSPNPPSLEPEAKPTTSEKKIDIKPKGLKKLLEITKTYPIEKKMPEEKIIFPKSFSKHSPIEENIIIKPIQDKKNFFDSPSSSDILIPSFRENKVLKITAPLNPEKSNSGSKEKTEERLSDLSLNYDIMQTSIIIPPDDRSREYSNRSSGSENSSKKHSLQKLINESLKPANSKKKTEQKCFFSSKFFENSGELSSDRSRKFSETTKGIIKASENLEIRKSDTKDAGLAEAAEQVTENIDCIVRPSRPTPLKISYKSDLFKSFNPSESSKSSSDINISQSDSSDLSPSGFQSPKSTLFRLSEEDWSSELSSIVSSEIYTFLRLVSFKTTEKEVDPSLDYIVDYVNVMANELKENEVEVLEAINTPVYQDPLTRLASFQDPSNPILSKFPTLELILPPDLCSELKVNFDSLDVPTRQIYLQMLFDCVNEALNYVRPFGVVGIPDPWSRHPRILFGEAELENVFNQVLVYMVKWASCRGGVFEQENLDVKLLNLREERMSSLLCLDIKDEEKDWLIYEEEETQMKILIGNGIFDTLINEIWDILTK